MLTVLSFHWFLVTHRSVDEHASRLNHKGFFCAWWSEEEERIEEPGTVLEDEVDPLRDGITRQ
jgi:hypothetical protein